MIRGDIIKKIAIVTGCMKGIGRQLVRDLSKNNYFVIGTYNKSVNEITSIKKEIGKNLELYHLDLSSERSIIELYNDIKKKYDKIDVIINNAALSMDNYFLNKTKEEFMKVLEVNLVGPFLLIQKLSSLLNDSKIINIASTNGINTYTKYDIDYSASKAGLINLTKSLALSLENSKIYAICPNWVNTESVREMDADYLKTELERVGQKKLIEPISVSKKIIDIINSDLESGSIVVMED